MPLPRASQMPFAVRLPRVCKGTYTCLNACLRPSSACRCSCVCADGELVGPLEMPPPQSIDGLHASAPQRRGLRWRGGIASHSESRDDTDQSTYGASVRPHDVSVPPEDGLVSMHLIRAKICRCIPFNLDQS
jgi:hypothetical protein